MKSKITTIVSCLLLGAILLTGCGQHETPSSGSETSLTESRKPDGIYVSSEGDDHNTGCWGDAVASIGRGIELAEPGQTVYVSEGIYTESVTLKSGTEEKPFVLCAVPGEKVTVTTAVKITAPWFLYSDNIYMADVSAIREQMDTEHPQLFCDEKALVDARYPNVGPYASEILYSERGLTKEGTDGRHIVTEEELSPGVIGAEVVIWPANAGSLGWDCSSAVIESVNGEILTLDKEITADFVPQERNVYYVVGALCLLDSPGEYFYDSREDRIYCYMPDGSSPEGHDMRMRGENKVINCDGCSYVTVDGITVYGGGISLRDAEHCTVSSCSIFYGDHASSINSNPYFTETAFTVSGNHNTVTGCWVGNTAFSGLSIWGNDHVVENNHITDVNYYGSNFAGIFIRSGTENVKICHNTIENSGRFLVYLMAGGKFDHCLISNNLLSGLSYLTSDCGAIYTWSTDGNGTVIRENLIRCISTEADHQLEKGFSGIYLDNYCSDFMVIRNIVHGSVQQESNGIHLNSTSSETLCANNTVYQCRYGFRMYGIPTDEADASTSVFSNNLFCGCHVQVGYYACENGKEAYYSGNLKKGSLPVPLTKERRFTGGGNLVCGGDVLDERYFPVEGTKPIDSAEKIEGITDAFTGNAPDVGAIEWGTDGLFYGCTLQ